MKSRARAAAFLRLAFAFAFAFTLAATAMGGEERDEPIGFALAAELRAASAAEASLGGATWRVEIAANEESRKQGLSGRRSLADDGGMLFVFEAPRRVCLWMRDALLPLDAVFLDSRLRVINRARMTPLTETRHCSERPALFALEVEGGALPAAVAPGTTATIRAAR